MADILTDEQVNEIAEIWDLSTADRQSLGESVIIQNLIATLRHYKAELQQACEIIDSTTPIANFDLVTSLKAEKQHMMEHISELQTENEKLRRTRPIYRELVIAQQENARLREALEWIGEVAEYREYTDDDCLDQIERKARQALATEGDKSDG